MGVANETLCLLLAILTGGAAAGVAGVVIGIPVLRLRGDYLAIVTLAFGEIIRNVINCLYISLDGQRLHAVPLPAGAQWQGYGGDISSDGTHFAVSCPRANTLTWWLPPEAPDGTAQCVQQNTQQGVYCISNDSVVTHSLKARSAMLWSGGSHQVLQWPQGQTIAAAVPLALDNHWVQI